MNKVAILIDGGFYLKQLPLVRKDVDITSAQSVAKSIQQLVRGHLKKLSKTQEFSLYGDQGKGKKSTLVPNLYAQHYRTFYYDALPFDGKTRTPISGKHINFSKTDTYQFGTELFDELRRERFVALRLGKTKAQNYMWQLHPNALKEIVQKKKQFEDLTDDDFTPAIRQKGVDMRMGLDMASISLKKQANIFVLVTGDADFVPAAKLVRREGGHIILDPLLHRSISPELSEHIDGLDSGFAHSKN